MRNNVYSYIEDTIDYIHTGLFKKVLKVLQLNITETSGEQHNPLALYYLGWISEKLDNTGKAQSYYNITAAASRNYCIQFKVEDIKLSKDILKSTIHNNTKDLKAHSHLGNLLFANCKYDMTIQHLERSVESNNDFPATNRNLPLPHFNKKNAVKNSVSSLEKIFQLNREDPGLLVELDKLYKINNYSHWHRLQLLEDHIKLVEQCDDLYLERIILYNSLGDFETSKALLAERTFNPREGGEGKVINQYILCYVELAKKAMMDGWYTTALEYLKSLETYPKNLGEEKGALLQENQIHFLQGIAYNKLGKIELAKSMFEKATAGSLQPVKAEFNDDSQYDKIFYLGLSWLQLGEKIKAKKIFNLMLAFSSTEMNNDIGARYFATSFPDPFIFKPFLNYKNESPCHYLAGLGYLGLQNYKAATSSFKTVLKNDCNHQGAITHLNLVEFLSWYDGK